jgi:hypothetical protein
MNTPYSRRENRPPARPRRFPFPLGVTNNPYSTFALLLLAAWACVNCFLSLRSVFHDYNPLPVWDYWQVIEHFDRYKSLDWSVLWVQHNEHRIVFPETIFAIDALLFHGRQIFTLVISFASYFGTWLALSFAYNSDKQLSRNVRAAGILLAAIVMFWQGSSVVVGNSFLLQWTMLQLTVVLSFFLLAMSARSTNVVYFAGSILCATIATYSSGNGMLLWPLLLIAALILRISRTRQAILGLSGAIAISLYFVKYQGSAINYSNLFKHPFYLVGFIFSYMSMPLGALGQPTAALRFGALNCAVVLMILAFAIRHRLLNSTPAIVLFGCWLFTLATALMTATGRMNPSDPNFIAALAARYVTVPLVGWALLLMLLLWLSARLKWKLASPAIIILLSSLCLASAVHKLKPWVEGSGSFVADQQVATVSIENGVADTDFSSKLYPDREYLRNMLDILKRNKLSIYSDSFSPSPLGKPLRSVLEICPQSQSHIAILSVYPILGGFQIVAVAPRSLSYSELLFTDEHGKLIGLGREIPAGKPMVVLNPSPKKGTYWIGFINARYEAKTFSAYGVSQDGRCAQQLTPQRQLGRSSEVQTSDLGSPVNNLTWEPAGWRSDTLPPAVTSNSAAIRTFWSSWNGSDQSVGKLTSSQIAIGSDHCLIVPLFHGPSTEHLSLNVQDAASAQILESIPMRTDEVGWKFWRVPIPEHVSAVKLVGEDSGSGWGQWLATAAPFSCK